MRVKEWTDDRFARSNVAEGENEMMPAIDETQIKTQAVMQHCFSDLAWLR